VKVVICPYDSHLLLNLCLWQEERGKRGNDHVNPEILSAYDDDGGDGDDVPPLSLW